MRKTQCARGIYGGGQLPRSGITGRNCRTVFGMVCPSATSPTRLAVTLRLGSGYCGHIWRPEVPPARVTLIELAINRLDSSFLARVRPGAIFI